MREELRPGYNVRIAFDYQVFCRQRYGGVSRYFFELAREVTRQHEADVTVVAPLYCNEYLRQASEVHVLGRYVPMIPRAVRLVQFINAMAVQRAFHMVRPDIVHETYYCKRRLAPRGVPVVVTVYDMIHEKYAQYFSGRNMTAKDKAAAVARADHVICISESTKRDLMEILRLPSEKISVIHLGFTSPAVDEVSGQGESLPMNRPFVLYVGNRDGHKNFVRLLEAYGTSSRVSSGYGLTCFGGGPFTNDESAMIQRLGLDGSQVRQLAGDDRLLARIYRGASLFVYPSLYEGFGIPPLEAMSHGCPVVCSNTSSIPEVVGDAGEYFEPGNVDSIRAAIERVAESQIRREELIAKGRERLRCFGWDRCAEQTLDVYRRLI